MSAHVVEADRLHAAELAASAEMAAIEADAPDVTTLAEKAAQARLDGAAVDMADLDAMARQSVMAERLSAEIDVLRSRRVDELRRILTAEADKIRAQAAKKRTEEKTHRAKTAKLLAVVSAHEGGASFGWWDPVMLQSCGRIGPGDVVAFPTSEMLANAAAALEAEARRIEDRTPTPPGAIESAVSSVDELVAMVAAQPATVLAPRLDAAAGWALWRLSPVLDRLAAADGVLDYSGGTARVVLVWGAGGLIDTERSTATLVAPTAGGYMSPAIPDSREALTATVD